MTVVSIASSSRGLPEYSTKRYPSRSSMMRFGGSGPDISNPYVRVDRYVVINLRLRRRDDSSRVEKPGEEGGEHDVDAGAEGGPPWRDAGVCDDTSVKRVGQAVGKDGGGDEPKGGSESDECRGGECEADDGFENDRCVRAAHDREQRKIRRDDDHYRRIKRPVAVHAGEGRRPADSKPEDDAD